MSEGDISSVIRDPNFAKERIIFSNLPVCRPEELESISRPYGNILGSVVNKKVGFVQFDMEESANKAASALHKSIFKGNTISVRNAGINPTGTKSPAKAQAKKVPDDYNDCEIIVINRNNKKYAEHIEDCMKRIGLQVDVLFPTEDVPMGEILANISSRGGLYAILVTEQHERYRSVNINILYGIPVEYRNMPLDVAIKLIADDFQQKMEREGKSAPNNQLQEPPPLTEINLLEEPHPDHIQSILIDLINNFPISLEKYDIIIKYLQECRLAKLESEGGSPDLKIALQEKIQSIFNKPPITQLDSMLYPDLEAAAKDKELVRLLCDPRIQAAIKDLFNSDVLRIVTEAMEKAN